MKDDTITDEQLRMWAHQQRHYKKVNSLSKYRQNKLEALPDWYWRIDFKQEAIDKCSEIFKRAQERGSLPKHGSKYPQEAQDASWISTRKYAKLGKGCSIWYPELDKIAKQYGFPDTFKTKKR